VQKLNLKNGSRLSTSAETEPVGRFTDVSQVQKLNTSYIPRVWVILEAWLRVQIASGAQGVKSMEKCKYTQQDRARAALTLLATGSNKAAAASIGCSRRTFERWTKQDWWQELVRDLYARHEAEFDAFCSQIIEQAMSEVQDRLENGDYSNRLDENGEWIRKQISGKDAAVIMGIMFDKLKILREQLPASIGNGFSLDSIREKLATIGRESAAERERRSAIDIDPER